MLVAVKTIHKNENQALTANLRLVQEAHRATEVESKES